VATIDYLLEGGDGYDALGNGEIVIDVSAGTHLVSAVINQVAEKKTVSPRVEGRVRRK
jgi:hypothetical protein